MKGNSAESVGTVASVEVLWESFGTDTAPSVGALVSGATYADGYITFTAFSKKGNAVIAAKDAEGTILWSWHIWLTDKPVDQVYNNGAGTMMDRNLGATSATPGDVHALGLMYQWGRKDPFMGGCQIKYSSMEGQTKAVSTGTWPSEVTSDASNGTIAYAVSHPMTFILRNTYNGDWYFSYSSSSTENTRWQTSDKNKSQYDPCPAGYRVPDGGPLGVLSRAFGDSNWITTSNSNWDSTNKGMNFGATNKTLGSASSIWYPSTGYLLSGDNALSYVGYAGYYWSNTANTGTCRFYDLYFDYRGYIAPSWDTACGFGKPVRCYKDGSSTPAVNVTGVSLDKTSLTLDVNEKATLTATVAPSNATFKSVAWKSSDTSVAIVDESGKVTAMKSGYATITATTYDGAKTAACLVTVKVPLTDLSSSGTANSYIVTFAGTYKFKTVKGNSTTSVGTVSSVAVLWESFGTDTAPSVGDLVSGVTYADGYITFTASSKKGNAVIAAKNSSGTILWSWHIWLTDKPVDQVYRNSAGKMMDRNLGATSATPGDAHALGLLYQWGRKDPFLGSSSISSSAKAASTGTWGSYYSYSYSGTIAYAVANPTTFLKSNSSNGDWYYTGSSSTDNTRWQTSGSSKGLYDPCPVGYRVPDGGESGVWSKAFGTSSYWTTSSNWDSTNRGMNFGATDKKLGYVYYIWYPSSGSLISNTGSLGLVGYYGDYWSCTTDVSNAYCLSFDYNSNVSPVTSTGRANGLAVRCILE